MEAVQSCRERQPCRPQPALLRPLLPPTQFGHQHRLEKGFIRELLLTGRVQQGRQLVRQAGQVQALTERVHASTSLAATPQSWSYSSRLRRTGVGGGSWWASGEGACWRVRAGGTPANCSGCSTWLPETDRTWCWVTSWPWCQIESVPPLTPTCTTRPLNTALPGSPYSTPSNDTKLSVVTRRSSSRKRSQAKPLGSGRRPSSTQRSSGRARVVACRRWLRRSHQAWACRFRSSRSVKRAPGQKLCLTTPILRSILPLVCGV